MKQPENNLTQKRPGLFAMDSQDILQWKIIHRIKQVLKLSSQAGIHEAFKDLKSLCAKLDNPLDIIQHFNDKELQQLRVFELLFNVLQARKSLEHYDAQFARGLQAELKPMQDILLKGYCALSVNQDLDGSSYHWRALDVEQFCQTQTQSIVAIYNQHLAAIDTELSHILQANCPNTFFEWLLLKIQEITQSLFGKSKVQQEMESANQTLFSSFQGATELRDEFQHAFFKPAPQAERDENQNDNEINKKACFQ